mmetsp:Transcript_41312/g.99523  ORF Transcript_41312/g.99523 Transcript_41312/m.99523 type:complete len:246 (-) Transcript_41312:168-905(-)|eukprot:CAMPEP_0113657502 /NCGR_PEP_ID=MMETSP0017_2-20120614/31086_1 /TAXON_ID=2856 /ORGANISM="Cylindrotheca closterium" /LENGTH=245 /DNA_ID=CAMNT_0000571445 /DNA_START=61 /DNA_END=798 /DNA_ORIENTATION=- /assembly_acc=CAM_ASM_000147
MKRPAPIHQPSTYRNGDVVLRSAAAAAAKRRKCHCSSGVVKREEECPLTARNLQRRKLRYASKDQVFTILNRRQISLQERNAMWISFKEFRNIQKETVKVIETIEANSKHDCFSSLSAASDLNPPPITATEPQELSVAVVPASPPSNNSEEEEETDCVCVRGLEQHTKLYLGTKLSVQRLMHETVEKIRLLEQQDGKDYGDVLAQLCQVCSATAVANALVLGERDAQEAAGHATTTTDGNNDEIL